jgi:multidrug transporter EmrE-like cation transporter
MVYLVRFCSVWVSRMTWVLLSVLLNAIAQIFLKKYAVFTQGFEGSKLSLVLNFNLMLAALCYATSIFTWIFALRSVKLSSAYPIQSLGYVIVGVLSVYIFREKMSIPYVFGLLIIIIGVFVMSLSIE